MMRTILFAFSILLSVIAHGQLDTIALKTGEKIAVKIQNIDEQRIGYINPLFGEDTKFSMSKSKVTYIKFNSGAVLPLNKPHKSTLPPMVIDKPRVIKFNLAQALFGSVELGYEFYLSPNHSAEIFYSYQPRMNNTPYGFHMLKFGPKIFYDFKFPFNRYTDYSLRGLYLKPELLLLRASLDPVHRKETTDPTIYAAALVGNFGHQLIFRSGFTLDYYLAFGVVRIEDIQEKPDHRNFGNWGSFGGFWGHNITDEYQIPKDIPFPFYGLGIRLGYNF